MFYVYHKVKGDRFGPADYDLISTESTRAAAQAVADSYNTAKNYTRAGFHYAVVRTRKCNSA